MATFHPFPRLPLELRIQIWEFAFEDDRILKVRRGPNSYRRGYWSPTPVPAVTRASQESRKYCSYQKAFVANGSSHYIWTKFDSDIIQMLSSVMSELSEKDGLEKHEIRHLRIEYPGDYESDFFYDICSDMFRYFLKLDCFDVLVPDLWFWSLLFEETSWRASLKSNVRIINENTREWIDAQTAGLYRDQINTGRGVTRIHGRIEDDWDDEEEDEDDAAERYKAIMKIRGPLPRIDLNY